ncbi:MAG: glycosyltransferase family 2 protein [Actinobacteria bacterium]|nr:MAG: glycosyltransferase family 2 protein [Actinomycetota bacterium]
MKLSVVIPAHDEEQAIGATVEAVIDALEAAGIEHEVLVIDDASRDRTAAEVAKLAERRPTVRLAQTRFARHGFGLAVRTGLEHFDGDAVAIFMADGSDHAGDLVAYHRLLEQGLDCAFGSRFLPGARVTDYPWAKLVLNRVVNWSIRALFRHGYNDTTNAFKAYRREVIDSIQPLLSHHFNLTVEMPLKAIVRGHSYGIVPISWENRAWGQSKLRLQEMGSRYLFIVLYVFLEHHLSRGDYRRQGADRGGHARLGPSRPGALVEIGDRRS